MRIGIGPREYFANAQNHCPGGALPPVPGHDAPVCHLLVTAPSFVCRMATQDFA